MKLPFKHNKIVILLWMLYEHAIFFIEKYFPKQKLFFNLEDCIILIIKYKLSLFTQELSIHLWMIKIFS